MVFIKLCALRWVKLPTAYNDKIEGKILHKSCKQAWKSLAFVFVFLFLFLFLFFVLFCFLFCFVFCFSFVFVFVCLFVGLFVCLFVCFCLLVGFLSNLRSVYFITWAPDLRQNIKKMLKRRHWLRISRMYSCAIKISGRHPRIYCYR